MLQIIPPKAEGSAGRKREIDSIHQLEARELRAQKLPWAAELLGGDFASGIEPATVSAAAFKVQQWKRRQK